MTVDRRYRSFRVRLPNGVSYYTVVDASLVRIEPFDEWLFDARFGRDLSMSTTASYAGAAALLLEWCSRTSISWQEAPYRLPRFIHWLKHHSFKGPVAVGPGIAPVRGGDRINVILTAVRGFFVYATGRGLLERAVLAALYDVVQEPISFGRGRERRSAEFRAKARHRVRIQEKRRRRATEEEAVALYRAAFTTRDRLAVALMGRAGLRRGEVAGLRRSDVHSLPGQRASCGTSGPHLHVIRRENINDATAKSRHDREVPLDSTTLSDYSRYLHERAAVPNADECDFLLVSAAAGHEGRPLAVGAINDLLERLSERAELGQTVTPHQLRHAFASNVLDAGGSIDEVQALLGHASVSSTSVYQHPSSARLRAAVDRVSPRPMKGDV